MYLGQVERRESFLALSRQLQIHDGDRHRQDARRRADCWLQRHQRSGSPCQPHARTARAVAREGGHEARWAYITYNMCVYGLVEANLPMHLVGRLLNLVTSPFRAVLSSSVVGRLTRASPNPLPKVRSFVNDWIQSGRMKKCTHNPGQRKRWGLDAVLSTPTSACPAGQSTRTRSSCQGGRFFFCQAGPLRRPTSTVSPSRL